MVGRWDSVKRGAGGPLEHIGGGVGLAVGHARFACGRAAAVARLAAGWQMGGSVLPDGQNHQIYAKNGAKFLLWNCSNGQ